MKCLNQKIAYLFVWVLRTRKRVGYFYICPKGWCDSPGFNPGGQARANEVDSWSPCQWAEQNLSDKDLSDASGQEWSLKNDLRARDLNFHSREEIILVSKKGDYRKYAALGIQRVTTYIDFEGSRVGDSSKH